MNYWILTILRLSAKLELMAEKLDKRAIAAANIITTDTMRLCSEIMALNDKKVLVVNLRVMLNTMTDALSDDERFLIECYSKNESLERIASYLGVCRSTVLRRLNKIVRRCASALAKIGITQKRLESDYRNFAPAINTYNKIRHEHTLRAQAAQSQKRQCECENKEKMHNPCALASGFDSGAELRV